MPRNLDILVFLILYLILANVSITTFDLNAAQNRNFKIEVKGAVKKPGLYEANYDDTVADVLERVGLNADADLDGLNLALNIHAAMVIVVPSKSDKYLISINSATIDELIKLDGIKEGLANNIIEYRESHGGFKTLEELMNVKGIAESKFEKIKADIRL